MRVEKVKTWNINWKQQFFLERVGDKADSRRCLDLDHKKCLLTLHLCLSLFSPYFSFFFLFLSCFVFVCIRSKIRSGLSTFITSKYQIRKCKIQAKANKNPSESLILRIVSCHLRFSCQQIIKTVDNEAAENEGHLYFKVA